ncbi:MAG: DNA translocase FtsK 4TM domain-containing protein [Patescibacteria group bacterium]|jgi:S-DNA-T family DNA segregation ATPase FtsK/SpoIIIE
MSKHRHPGRPRGSKSYRDDDEDDFEPFLSPQTRRGITVIFLLAAAVISILSLFGLAGVLGEFVQGVLTYLFGWDTWLFPVALLLWAYLMILPARYAIGFINYFGVLLLVLSFNGFLHWRVPLREMFTTIGSHVGGGYLGLFLAWPFQKIMGPWATLAALLALLLISVMVSFNTSLGSLAAKSLIFNRLWERLKNLFSRSDDSAADENYANESEDYQAEAPEEIEESAGAGAVVAAEPTGKKFSAKKVADGPLPLLGKHFKKIDIPLDLLIEQKDKPSAGDIKVNQERIRKTLENFGIIVEMGEVSIGPTVTQYTLKPSEGVKLSQITTLHNDLALALAAHPIRIEAPIPGQSLVGIEVPNQTIATVGLREILSSREFATRKSNLAIALGKDVAGKPWLANVDSMPHMLIAGATGSGKTVCINAIIVSLLYQNSPSTLRMIMVDPKRVELPVYNGIPHLMTPVITDVKKTINALKWTIGEMDRRFELLAKTGHRDIHSFNRASADKMPYLVLIVDELADLMQTSGADVEGYIIRLAQLARATGIHLILATQRPSVDVITGLIKANVTSRAAFAVASGTDSRTILDHAGAEKLLGRGDMLYISASLSKPKRLQGAFVSDDEIRRIVEYIKGQNGEVAYDQTITEKQTVTVGGLSYDSDSDELLPEAKELVIRAGKASASYLQRRLRIGYARAARLLDLLEEQGVIGPGDGAKPRELLMTAEDDFAESTMAEAEPEEAAAEVAEEEAESITEETEADEEVEDTETDEAEETKGETEIEDTEEVEVENEVEEIEEEEDLPRPKSKKINDDELI